jgi:hypothetical protein
MLYRHERGTFTDSEELNFHYNEHQFSDCPGLKRYPSKNIERYINGNQELKTCKKILKFSKQLYFVKYRYNGERVEESA